MKTKQSNKNEARPLRGPTNMPVVVKYTDHGPITVTAGIDERLEANWIVVFFCWLLGLGK